MAVIVKYKDKTYLWYGKAKNGGAKMLTMSGKKFSGTPSKNKLIIVLKKLKHVEFNGHKYVLFRNNIHSCTSGNLVTSKAILNLMEK